MSGRDNTPRTRNGRWVAGGPSPNPGGRPSTPKEVLDFIGAHTLEAAERLVAIMRGKDPQQARLAAEAMLDRRLGKPAQSIDVTAHRGSNGLPGGSPDAARARLEAMIAEAQASAEPNPAITGTSEPASNVESGSLWAPSPTENGSDHDSDHALSARSSDEATP